MKSEVCSKCRHYNGDDCVDQDRKTPISLVFQCGIADQIELGEPNDGQR